MEQGSMHRQMNERVVYFNGEIIPESRAVVSFRDRSFKYGDGAFDTTRTFGHRIFKLREHLDRLYNSARAIMLDIAMSKKAMEEAVLATLRANRLRDAYIRLVVTRGAGTLGLDPNRTSDPQIIIIADHIALYPEDYYRKGLEIITASTMRAHPATLNPRIKSLNYLNNILAKIEGLQAGCIEALMLNHKGEVAECTGDNIFIVKNGVLLTPPTDAGILEGITREAVMQLARDTKREVREQALTRHDVYVADECFLTGTAAEVVPVVKVDSRAIGDGTPGPITRDLMDRFRKLTRS
jgi:branched-chain amino acid aminotransferase